MKPLHRTFPFVFALALCAVPRALFALTVTDMSPTPGTTLTAPPTSITVTLDQPSATGSANANSVRLVRAGVDGVFGTADDVVVVPAGISTNGNLITVNLTGVKLPNDQYQVTLVSGQGITSGLIANWKFDEGSGTTALDSSGNNNTGTLNSGASYTSTNLVLPGSAVKFDGVTGAIKVPQSASLEPSSAVTVSMWGYLTDTMGGGVGELLRKQTVGLGGYILRWNVDDGHIGWFICANTGQYWYSRDPQPNSNYLNAWHHYAATYDSATHLLNLYIDGTLRNSVSGGPAGGLDHTDDLYLMFRNNQTTNATPGTLDDVRVFNRALTAAEIRALANFSITDSNGNPLDGNFTGTFPSGDGTFKDFVASFAIATPPLTVTNVSVTPGSTLTAAPSSVVVTFNRNVDAETVSAGTLQLVRAGPDGILGTADDAVVTPASVALAGNQATLDLTGVPLPNDQYQLALVAASGASVLQFDGTAALVQIPYFGQVSPTSEVTIEFWQNVDAVKLQSTFSLQPDVSGNRCQAYVPNSDGKVYWDFGDDNGAGRLSYTPPTSIVGSWQHFALVSSRSGNFMKIYRNGVLEASKSGASTYAPGTNDLRLGFGYVGSSLYFGGRLAEFRVWNVARTQSQILSKMNGRLTGVEPGLAGYWPFSETAGQAVIDHSQNAHNGTLGIDASVAADDPVRVTSTVPIGIADTNGNPLDGKFTGAFPSGDGTFKNFVETFTVAVPPLRVTALTLAPNAVIAAQPTSIVATFNGNPDPASVDASSVKLVNAGPDGLFDTGDDIAITPHAVSVAGTQITMDLTGVNPPAGRYRLTLASGAFDPVTTGLRAYLKFDEGTGTLAGDASGHGNSATLVGGATWAVGKLGSALNVNGTTSSADFSSAALNVGANEPFTYAGWVKTTDSYGAVVALRNTVDINGATIDLLVGYNTLAQDPGKIKAIVRQDGGGPPASIVGPVINDGLWHHVALTRNTGSTIEMFVDGISQGTDSTAASGGPITTNLRAVGAEPLWVLIGTGITGQTDQRYLSGQIDDLRIYNRALTNSEIQSFASAHPAVTDTNGNIIDGEFTGAFPSGNGTPGGDFVATFHIDSVPVAANKTGAVHTGVALPITLSATDADQDALVYSIVTPPAHGTLSGTLPNVTYTSGAYAGLDSFTYKANDGIADSNVATVSITVVDQPPAASLTAAPTVLIEGQSVDFNSGASDPDGDALTYSWNFGDDGNSTDANPSHLYATAGDYTASVTVTDIGGVAVTQSIVIHVYHDSDRPIARFVSSDLNGYVNQPIGFDATFSIDPLNSIVSYVWDFGDGSPRGLGQLISRDYTATGTYTVTLTITNGQGLTDTTSLTMVVLPATQAGLFSANIKYSVSWNRTAQNADSLSLTASVNVGATPVTSASPLSLNVVGQTFSGTSAMKLSLSRAGSSDPQVRWQLKANTKKGAPKGTYELKCAIKHASVGQAFALAGVTGVKSSTAKIPLRIGIGGSHFESSIPSQFRFGSNGAKASGGGQGPK